MKLITSLLFAVALFITDFNGTVLEKKQNNIILIEKRKFFIIIKDYKVSTNTLYEKLEVGKRYSFIVQDNVVIHVLKLD